MGKKICEGEERQMRCGLKNVRVYVHRAIKGKQTPAKAFYIYGETHLTPPLNTERMRDNGNGSLVSRSFWCFVMHCYCR